ncbi:LysE family translocator [Hoeflea olei]|uniref:Amino acid transporter n=1 Tax=Hoeflea olei TaxID=1480615 RepID=A0A1C1YYL1_9HYPH|nr:LysE family translocator [Hoeflea olei]OCW58623.1 amino acid transporter [Hoeflea olei]
MTFWTVAAVAAVAFISAVTPGPTVLLALANGSRTGFRRSVWGMLGAVMSDLVLIGTVAIGLGALLAASEFWFSVLKWVGVAYLAYLGVQMLRSKGNANLSGPKAAAAPDSTAQALFLKSFLVAVTNPKGYIFFSAFLPQFITVADPQLPQYAILAVAIAAVDFLAMAVYAGLGMQAMKLLTRKGLARLDHFCGGVMLLLAGTLAMYRKSAT